jgi:hypothetical protein
MKGAPFWEADVQGRWAPVAAQDMRGMQALRGRGTSTAIRTERPL